MVGFAPQGSSTAMGAALWDAGVECTRHLTWCPHSRDLSKVILTLPPSQCAVGNEKWTPSEARQEERGNDRESGKRRWGVWGLWQPCTLTPTVGPHLSDTGDFYFFSYLSCV